MVHTTICIIFVSLSGYYSFEDGWFSCVTFWCSLHCTPIELLNNSCLNHTLVIMSWIHLLYPPMKSAFQGVLNNQISAYAGYFRLGHFLPNNLLLWPSGHTRTYRGSCLRGCKKVSSRKSGLTGTSLIDWRSLSSGAWAKSWETWLPLGRSLPEI